MSEHHPKAPEAELHDAVGAFRRTAARYTRGARDSQQRLRLSLAQKRENSSVGTPVPKELHEKK